MGAQSLDLMTASNLPIFHSFYPATCFPYPSVRWLTIIDGDEVLVAGARQFAQKLSGIKGAGATDQNGSAENVCPECGYKLGFGLSIVFTISATPKE
jgi:hypothetical protein